MEKLILPEQGNIGILNRGEAALRFIRAVKEFNVLNRTSLKTVAFYLPEEEEAPFVQQADMAFSFTRLKGAGKINRNVYLNKEQLGEALAAMNCVAAWVGWGFLSEDADFIRYLEDLGIIFFGPSSVSVSLLGDKIAAKELAEKNKVPVTPWSKGTIKNEEEALAFADAIGYPCMIKAACTGGGRGIRRVNSKEELLSKYESAREETLRLTGAAILFIEQIVEKGRHLEVQALADRYGNVQTFGVRDCSVQRRNQKIIEETPPPNFSTEIMEEMEQCSVRLLQAAGYESAGTVEFLYDLNNSQFYFMEVNTRLQVEHPITEQAYGVDLVQGQIDVAMGRHLSSGKKIRQLCAVELRLNAEDPDQGFTPAPGKVLHFQIPAGPGLRIDSGISQGTTIPADFDSMIAKIIAFAPTRELAFAKLHRALDELQLKIEGGTSNRAFLKALLNCPEIRQGGVHTRFVEELLARKKEIIEKKDWNVALLAAAVEQYLAHYKENLVNFKQQLTGTGYPRELTVSRGMEMQLKAAGNPHSFLIKAVGVNQYLIQTGKINLAIEYHLKKHGALLKTGNFYYTIQTVPRGSDLQVEVDGVPYLVELESGGTIKAPSPAIVISIPVKPGQKVEKGQLLVILEAMKMEMIVQAPEAGMVKELLVRAGEQVAAGQALLLLETGQKGGTVTQEPGADSVSIVFDVLVNEENQWKIVEQEFRSVFLGYNHEPVVQKILDRALACMERDEQQEKLVSLFLSGLKSYIDIERMFFSAPVKSEKLSRLTTYSELLSHYFRRQVNRDKGLPDVFLEHLQTALSWYVSGDTGDEAMDEAVHHLYLSHSNLTAKQELLQKALAWLEKFSVSESALKELPDQLDALAYMSQATRPALSDAAIHTRYRLVDHKIIQAWKEEKRENMARIFDRLVQYERGNRIYNKLIEFIMENKYHLLYDLVQKAEEGTAGERDLVMEILAHHMSNDRQFVHDAIFSLGGFSVFYCETVKNEKTYATNVVICAAENLGVLFKLWEEKTKADKKSGRIKSELIILINHKPGVEADSLYRALLARPQDVLWVCLGILYPDGTSEFRSYQYNDNGVWCEDTRKQGFTPRAFREFRIYRLTNFDQEIVYSSEFIQLLLLKSRDNPKDERFYAMVEVPSTNVQFDENGRILRMVALENVFMEAVYAMRAEQARRKHRLHWNRIIIHLDTLLKVTLEQNTEYTARLIARAGDLGIERIVIYSRQARKDDKYEDVEIFFDLTAGSSFTLHTQRPEEDKLSPTDNYSTKVVRARQLNSMYPYEILKMITRSSYQVKEVFPKGIFEEYDIRIDAEQGTQQTVAVKNRPYGENPSNVVFGIISNYPEFCTRGLKRVILLADSTRDMGALTEAECRRIIAAIDLAASGNLPLEWLPVSAGARIDMVSGTENLDWTARVLRRIIEFTQAGGEINIIVLDINIGAQSYWNAEATMLMHTRGLLMMSENAALLLTGKKALDFSGSVSAENNISIGGVEQIMGPNGESQVMIKNIYEAYMILFKHYALTYRYPGCRFPAPVSSADPAERNICETSYADPLKQGFEKIGDIFSQKLNPERKKPFDMRQLMRALVDTDGPVLERWMEMKDAEMAIVWEARLGGYAIGMIGIESQPLARIGEIPHDGPEVWSGGTLFPLSSKKIARAINAFSSRLPLVIMANLSGFDGSPESLRKLQLEYGAEIGKAIVNFRGPVFFVVTARYHGGAYVVFSKTLNPELKAIAIEGSYASVIGGAPAAAVVFPRQVLKDTYADPRIVEAQKKLSLSLPQSQKEFDELFQQVYTEKQTELARKFDKVHSVERAKKVGSIDEIIKPEVLRPYLVQHLAAVYGNDSGKTGGDQPLDFNYG